MHVTQIQNSVQKCFTGWECLSVQQVCIQLVSSKKVFCSHIFSFFFFNTGDTAAVCDHLENRAPIVVSLGGHDSLLSRITSINNIPLMLLSILPTISSSHTYLCDTVVWLLFFPSIAWWMMLFYPPGSQIQVCLSVYRWFSWPWRRLPARCWRLWADLLPSSTLQSRTRPGGSFSPVVWSVPHQAAQ